MNYKYNLWVKRPEANWELSSASIIAGPFELNAAFKVKVIKELQFPRCLYEVRVCDEKKKKKK